MKSYLFTALWISLWALEVIASCGSATCPIDTRSSLESKKGFVRLGYEFEFIDQDQPRIGTRPAAVGEMSGHHDEQRTINRVHRFLGTLGLSDRLSLDFAIPMISRSHRHIHHHHGETLSDGWDFMEVGDFSLQSRYAFYKPTHPKWPTLFGIAGIEFPTGKAHLHNDDGDEAEPGITTGSASYDYIVGVATLQYFGSLPFFTSVNYKINGNGHDDYRLGNTLAANMGATFPIGHTMGIMTQLNTIIKERDDQGATFEEVGKTGGEYLYVSPGVQFRMRENVEWSTLVQIPVYQRVNQIQLTSDYNVVSSLSYKFRI